MRRLLNSVCLLILVVVGTHSTYAQLNLPLSRYGIGVTTPTTFTAQRGMGSLSAGFSNYQYINQVNPASYTGFYKESYTPFTRIVRRDTTIIDPETGQSRKTFYRDTIVLDTLRQDKIFKATAFETGIDLNSYTIRNLNDQTRTTDGSLSYLAMGFPMPKLGGLSFGLMPYSTVGYSVDETLSGDTTIGRIQNSYRGDGGIFQFYFGGAVKFGNLSVGLNGRYLFGSINRTATTYLLDQPNSLGSQNTVKNSISGLLGEAGLQYAINLNQNIMLRLGVYGQLPTAINANTDSLNAQVLVTPDATVNVEIDTINLNYPGKLELPLSFGAGFVLERSERWMVGMDFTYKNWSAVPDFQTGNTQNDEWRFSGGIQFVPKAEGRSISRTKLRAGGYYGQSPLILNGQAVYDYGMTIGAGFPIIRPKESLFSTIDLSLQIGGLGSVTENGLNQSYVQGTIGFNLNDNRWIFKQKFY